MNAPRFTSEQNLACDEALLEACNAGETGEVLRFWESPDSFVVVGYGQSIGREVDSAACRERGIPILRRSSGGGTVLQGPGCLNYSLILRIRKHDGCRTITSTNDFIMQRHRAVMARLAASLNPAPALPETLPRVAAAGSKAGEPIVSLIEIQGVTDLTWRGRKFSGNAQRRRQHALLFHGTFLLHLDLTLVDALLPHPSRQPGYRQNRRHSDFLTNLPVSAKAVKTALIQAWAATDGTAELPTAAMERLIAEQYGNPAWTDRTVGPFS
jgi:lipoate-protein ligase A